MGRLNLNIFQSIKLDWITKKAGLDLTSADVLRKRLDLLNIYCETHKNNWLIFTEMGFLNLRFEHYVEAVHAYETSYKLKPKMPLSTYNLSTAYRMLSKAAYLKTRTRIIESNPIYQSRLGTSFNPEKCKKAIDELDISLDIVIKRFLECSYTTLELLHYWIWSKDFKHIIHNTGMIKDEFPGYNNIMPNNIKQEYLPSLLK